MTLGLPFPRTSPDHGTAFDIAGTGRADETKHEESDSAGGGAGGREKKRKK